MNICGREGWGRVIVYCGVGDGVTDGVGKGESVCDSDSIGIDESVGDSAGVDAVFWSCVELIITASAVVWSC